MRDFIGIYDIRTKSSTSQISPKLNFVLQGLSPEVDDLTTRASKFSAQLKATVCQIFSFLFEINTIVVIIATCMMTR